MQFTFIIVACNVGPYIKNCIDSIKAQSINDFETLVVMETSSDNTEQAAREAIGQDPRFRLITGPKTGSASRPRNIGMSEARGDYLIFIDGDDWVDPKMLSTLVPMLTDKPDMVYYGAFYHNEFTGKVSFSHQCQRHQAVYETGIDLISTDLPLRGGFLPAVWRWCLRRQMGLPEQAVGRWHQDQDWTYRVLLKAKKIKICDEALYHYRQRAGSVTQTPSPKTLEDMTAHSHRLLTIMQATTDAKVFKILARYLVESFVHGRFFGFTKNNVKPYPRKEWFKKKLCLDAMQTLLPDEGLLETYKRALQFASSAQRLEGRLICFAHLHPWSFTLCRTLEVSLFYLRHLKNR